MIEHTRRLAPWMALLLLHACGGEPPPADDEIRLLPPDETPNPIDGRTIDVTLYEGDERSVRQSIVLGSDDPVLTQMLGYLEQICTREAHLAERFEETVLAFGEGYREGSDGCGPQGAAQQQMLLCVGHKLMGMAEAVMPQDFVNDEGQMTLRQRTLDEEGVVTDLGSPLLTIPVQDNQSRGSLAMWASLAFQRAAMAGARMLDSEACVDGTLDVSLPPYDGAEDRTPLPFVVASATFESMQQMTEAADRGRQEIRAQAAEQRASDPEPARATQQFFRARHGSLLEAASIFARVPTKHFDIPQPGLTEAEAGDYDTCIPPVTGEIGDAEDMLRAVQVNPTLGRSELMVTMSAALVADQPERFASMSGASPETIIEAAGVSPSLVVQAARRISAEAVATGRVMTPFMQNGVSRVTGTTLRRAPAPAAFQFARTVGDAVVHHEEGDGHFPSVGYGPMGVADIGSATSNEYGRGPTLEALDVVATSITGAMRRADVRSATPDGEERTEAAQLLQAARLFARTKVPMRAQVCVGDVVDGSLNRARVRLFGTAEAARYDVVIGEAGLQCATEGGIEGEPCNLDEHRVSREAVRTGEGARNSGLGDSFVEVGLDAESLPEGASIGDSTHLYLVERTAGTREPIAAFAATPMEGGGDEWSRCTYLPAGAEVLAEIGETVNTAGDDCSQPLESCAGVPFDQRIPLEDELAHALGTPVGDDFDTSWAHYLEVARQAAIKSDSLGREYVENGLQYDLRVEAASEELAQICGVSLPSTHLPGSYGCETSDECAPLGSGYSCVQGACFPDGVESFLDEDENDPALLACLDGGDPTIANLGTEPLCGWSIGGGALCAIPEGHEAASTLETIGCPWRCPNEPPELEGLGVETIETTPLGLVPQAPVGLSPNVCNDFADFIRFPEGDFVLGEGASNNERLGRILASDWLEHVSLDSVATYLRWQDGPLYYSSINAGSGSWLSLGTLSSGESSDWPCAARDDLGATCSAPLAGERGATPLSCGYECRSFSSRHHAHDHLLKALIMLDRVNDRYLGHVPQRFATMSDGIVFHGHISEYPHLLEQQNEICATDRYDSNSPACEAYFANSQVASLASQPAAHTIWFPTTIYRAGQTDQAALSVDRAEYYGTNGFIYPSGSSDVGSRRAGRTASLTDLWTGSDPLIERILRDYASGRIHAGDPIRWSDYGGRAGIRILTAENRSSTVEGAHYDIKWGLPRDGDQVRVRAIPEWEVTYADLLRGLELGCVAANQGARGLTCDAEFPESVESVEDIEDLASSVECVATAMRAQAGATTITGMPRDLAEQLSENFVESTFPHYEGRFGSTIANLQSELQSIPRSLNQVSTAMSRVGQTMKSANLEMRKLQNLSAITSIRQLRDELNLVTECAISNARAAAGTASLKLILGGGAADPVISMMTCTNNLAQIAIGQLSEDLEQENIELEQRQTLLGALSEMRDAAAAVEDARLQFHAAIGRVNSLIAELDSLRGQAQTQVSKVLGMDPGDPSNTELPVNSVMRARLATARIRYEEARDQAVRLAYLARRAIEARLGVDLSSMSAPMTLVEPPAEWVDDVCALDGIDYAVLRGTLPGDRSDYAAEFIGDYIDRLELAVQSYRLDRPFEDSRDVAVVSLRDDVHVARQTCDAQSYNRLLESSFVTSSAWETGCVPGERCVGFSPPAGAESGPFRERYTGSGLPIPRPLAGDSGVDLASACLEADVTYSGSPAVAACAATSGGALTQTVTLDAGTYLLSWFEELPSTLDSTCVFDPVTCDGDCVEACQAACAATAASTTPQVDVVLLSDDPSLPTVTTPAFVEPEDPYLDACNWRRVVSRIEVPSYQEVDLGFTLPVSTSALSVSVGFGAPQLESLTTAEASLMSVTPASYFPTDEDRFVPFGSCPDTEGTVFRGGRYWDYECEYLCPEGFAESCVDPSAGERGRVSCFWETHFHVDQDRIDRGEQFPNGGLASGNFNYRHGTLAVNLVGVGVRDCAGTDNPSACYASGSVPFSLRHDGPFWVRNHAGEQYAAPHYTGTIQHGRALAAERYLTNPLASADRGLLADYWRTEFRGRTLAGSYTLRIYDSPGLQWQNLEDVQLVLDYGYWTRFE